ECVESNPQDSGVYSLQSTRSGPRKTPHDGPRPVVPCGGTRSTSRGADHYNGEDSSWASIASLMLDAESEHIALGAPHRSQNFSVRRSLVKRIRSIGRIPLVFLSIVISASQTEAAGMLKTLRLEPEGVVLGGRGSSQRFTVTAVYSDGNENDAT